MQPTFFDLMTNAASLGAIPTTTVTLRAGQTLYSPGERPTAVYFPVDCLLALGIGSADGDIAGVSLIGREGMAGGLEIMAGGASYGSCTVQITGSALRLSATAFSELLEQSARVRRLMAKLGLICLAEAQQWAVCSMLHLGENRYAEKVLKASDRTGRPGSVALTQQSLAMLLGMQRTTVTAIATSLQERRIINGRRGQIEILDHEALLGIACRCRGDLEAFTASLMADEMRPLTPAI